MPAFTSSSRVAHAMRWSLARVVDQCRASPDADYVCAVTVDDVVSNCRVRCVLNQNAFQRPIIVNRIIVHRRVRTVQVDEDATVVTAYHIAVYLIGVSPRDNDAIRSLSLTSIIMNSVVSYHIMR